VVDAIRVQELTKTFGALSAVDHLSFTVAEGEIFGLVGPDGAGKTSAMRLLTAIMDPTSGDAWVNGYHVVSQSERVKENIGYMSQRFGLYPDLTVLENILFYADIYDVPRRGRAEKIERLLAFSNLTPFRRRLAGNLSGGMKQKLGLACALIHTPKVLFLDEPTNGVDPVSRRDFWRILYQLLREKVTIFVSTAYLDEAERANRLALINRGKLLACGTPDEVKRLMRGAILEIRSRRPRDSAALLRAQLEAESIGLFGDRIHVVTLRPPEETARQAGELLDRAGMPPLEVRRIEPSLEDVFVSVLAREPAAVPRGTTVAMSVPAEDRTMAVTVVDLEKRFGGFVAVNRVSFDVRRGEIFGFLGPNGAGKSTTIRMLCGLLTPSSGSGTVAGFDIRTEPERIKLNIGYMSQKFSLYEDLTVEENIDFYSGIYCIPAERKRQRKQWVIEMAGLAEHRKTRTALLSGGWKQRLALGCAILHEPPILFLDEPTSGVDPVSRRQFWDLIYDMADHGVTIFVTTHYMDEAEYCDRLGLIYRGELIALGTPAALKTDSMPEAVLEVICSEPEKALAELENLPTVKEAALFGTRLHVVAPDGDAAMDDCRRLLAERGHRLEAIGKILPSLEDVFVSLIEARDRAEQPQAEVAR
jgi:ABC-2 type transport system ATP-binding protein